MFLNSTLYIRIKMEETSSNILEGKLFESRILYADKSLIKGKGKILTFSNL